jgi:hypothetical protein
MGRRLATHAIQAMLLLAMPAVARAGSWSGFGVPVRFPMGAPVVSLGSHETANGPGLIVCTNGLGATVFRGFGHGAFQQRTDVAGGFVVSAAMDDLNGDAIPDLVVPSYFGASFTIYLGTAHGGFAPGQTYPVDGHCTWVATGDFNEDGIVDITAARNGSGRPVQLYIYLGNGDGTFTRSQAYDTPLATPTEIAVARIDSDSHLDIAYSLSGLGVGALFRGNGDGTLGPPLLLSQSTNPGGNSQGFGLADLDGDGNLDWIAAQDFIDSVVVRSGDGSGHFLASAGLPIPHPWDVETADLDGDGKLDLVVANLDSAVCYLRDQDGRYRQAATIHSPGGVARLLISDLDGDGLPDLVFSGLDNSFSVAINKGSTTLVVDPPPSDVELLPNEPNPTVRTTVFQFRLSQEGRVRLVLYDLLGRRVATLLDGNRSPGMHQVPFDASSLIAGGYFYRLYVHNEVLTGRMTVVR